MKFAPIAWLFGNQGSTPGSNAPRAGRRRSGGPRAPSPGGGSNDDSTTVFVPQFGEPVEWRVLSVRQPFAWLLATGLKDVENRTWETAYRGPILIHAGKTLHAGHKELTAVIVEDGYTVPQPWPQGGIVGAATLSAIVTKKRFRRDDWFEGPFGWVLTDPVPLPFTPLKGQLQLFTTLYPALLNYPPNPNQR